MKTFHEQYIECSKNGYTKEHEFYSFSEYPEYLPLFPIKDVTDNIKSKSIIGITLIKCGKFKNSGKCSSSNSCCIKDRESYEK